ncbi:hypothetical protein [Mycobacterium colombiense]|uniref:hypothetical protein n=1 Tax=Mycobacterium colombiense TaxID=339268 RepID=UPI0004BCE533|nr:hypothetical protein [Mycobacterium colombiense]
MAGAAALGLGGYELTAPAVKHGIEHRLVSSEQRNVIEPQNLRNETRQLVSHVGRYPRSC